MPEYPVVKIETSEGAVTVELWDDVAPNHAANFLRLVDDGFYNGLSFHRILPNFMIQGGCPKGDGTGNPGWTVAAEFNDRRHEPGVLSMARSSDPDSAGSQFFICLTRASCQHLDGQYTAFGKVTAGMETVEKIATTALSDKSAGKPAQAPAITQARRE